MLTARGTFARRSSHETGRSNPMAMRMPTTAHTMVGPIRLIDSWIEKATTTIPVTRSSVPRDACSSRR